jgi:alpha-tubulin suppressor-like RCC1 family protein
VQVGTDTNWSSVSASSGSTMALRTTGTLWGFGRNYSGNLGSIAAFSSSPVQIGSSTDWSKISLSYRFSVMSKNTGTLWAMGRNDNGCAMFITNGHVYDPMQIGTDSNWSSISAGIYHSLAIKTTGTLWAWGRNNYGQLGFGDSTYRSSPVQVGTGTDWSILIPTLSATVAAIKTNGSLFAWGQNNFRALGLGNNTNRFSPVQIGSDTDWQGEGGIRNHMFIKKGVGGQLWSAGSNTFGQVRILNSSISSPVQVGSSTNWYKTSVNHLISTGISKQTL